jgi:hypothetical protein
VGKKGEIGGKKREFIRQNVVTTTHIKPMNSLPIYHTLTTILKSLPLSTKLTRVTRLFTLGVLAAGSCHLSAVAHALSPVGTRDSQYRRLQRFLANSRVERSAVQTAWAAWVLQQFAPTRPRLLVDETKLSTHVSIMVLGLGVEGGCIPLAWRCYPAKDYPKEGQVKLICHLVETVLAADPTRVYDVLADRGIGTSPDLIQALHELNVRVLFRVQGSVKFQDPHGGQTALKEMVQEGEHWQSFGEVFKKCGWLKVHAQVLWGQGYRDPWCLVSTEAVAAEDYGQRFQQECSFRDLKSDGFDWHTSHIWMPEHAERLILILAMAYALVMALAMNVARPQRGRATRYSRFRWGLEQLKAHVHPTILPLLPHPPPRFVTCVVQ